MSYASALRGGRYALTFWKGCRVRSLRFMGASDDRILECVLCVLSLGRLAMWLVGGVRGRPGAAAAGLHARPRRAVRAVARVGVAAGGEHGGGGGWWWWVVGARVGGVESWV